MLKNTLLAIFMMGLYPLGHTQQPPAPAPKSLAASTLQGTPQLPKAMNHRIEDATGSGKVVGIVTISGILRRSKGRMGIIGNMIIPAAFLEGENGWKPEYEKLVGKRVEARGEHYRYFCGPDEQCMGGGEINTLRDIEYLRRKR